MKELAITLVVIALAMQVGIAVQIVFGPRSPSAMLPWACTFCALSVWSSIATLCLTKRIEREAS